VSAHGDAKQQRHRSLLRRGGVLALALAASSGTPFASMYSSRSFNVTVTLNAAAEAATGQCGTTVEPGSGRKVTLVCAPAAPPRDTPRYLLHVYRAGEWLGEVDGQMGAGTVTSWRIVHVANREYLEMMVGW
jgi:hypothetical protein